MSKHTPGPCKIARANYAMGAKVCLECEEADKRLRAAAPVMLEALRRAVPWLGKMIADGAHNNAVLPRDAEIALDRAESAIRAATGEK